MPAMDALRQVRASAFWAETIRAVVGCFPCSEPWSVKVEGTGRPSSPFEKLAQGLHCRWSHSWGCCRLLPGARMCYSMCARDVLIQLLSIAQQRHHSASIDILFEDMVLVLASTQTHPSGRPYFRSLRDLLRVQTRGEERASSA